MYASKVVGQAQAWIGKKESNGTHKEIIDIYNTYEPHPRGYKMTYDAPWCATFVSAIAIKLDCTEIIPVECSCSKMIELAKQKGIWVESDSRTPKPGDFMLYDWDDNGKGDNVGSPDHIGVVEKVEGTTITVIEGNYLNAVTRRHLQVNGRYIRGYIVPKYDAEPKKTTTNKTTTTSKGDSKVNIKLDMLKKGSKGEQVKALQRMLYAMGYKLGDIPIDGDFGEKTDAAVRFYQEKKGLEVDGIVGQNTWTKLLGA